MALLNIKVYNAKKSKLLSFNFCNWLLKCLQGLWFEIIKEVNNNFDGLGMVIEQKLMTNFSYTSLITKWINSQL